MYSINEKGYYGEFGGAYIPEMLYPNVEEFRQNYLKIMAEPSFKEEFDQLLKDWFDVLLHSFPWLLFICIIFIKFFKKKCRLISF